MREQSHCTDLQTGRPGPDLRRVCPGVSPIKSLLFFFAKCSSGTPLDPIPYLGPAQQVPSVVGGVGSSGARREPSEGLEDVPTPALPPAAAEAHVLQLVAAAQDAPPKMAQDGPRGPAAQDVPKLRLACMVPPKAPMAPPACVPQAHFGTPPRTFRAFP